MTSEPTAMPYDRDRLLELAASYCDGIAAEQDVAWLEQLLAVDADARRDFMKCSFVHGQATLVAAIRGQEKSRRRRPSLAAIFPEVAIASRRSRVPRGRWAAAMLLAVAVGGAVAGAAGIFGMLGSSTGPGGSFGASGSARSLATVTQSRFLRVPHEAEAIRVGQSLDAGRLSILSGAVEMTLRNGVTIVMQGPGEIDLIDEMHAFLDAGNAVVRVPKGMRGFRLDTASTNVLDLGTEFAVQAGNGLVTDVQVYDGAVIATGRDSRSGERYPKRLEAGQAARFNPQSPAGMERIPYSESRFVRRLPSEPGVEHVWWRGWKQADKERLYFGNPRHDSIRVARAAGPVDVDAALDEWTQAPGFTAALHDAPGTLEQVDGRMMYDDDCLYIAAHVRDPFPMRNAIDPHVDSTMAWQGGSVEVRISTDRKMGWPADANGPAYYRARNLEPTAEARAKAENRRLSHLAMLYHAPSGRASLVLRQGMNFSETDEIIDPEGFHGAFALDGDGRGYVLEYAIPWRLLNSVDDPPSSGDALAAIWQVHWSDATGQIWRNQVIEVRNPHEIHHIVPFERAATWGRAEFQ
jgi:hypothetical protein